MTMTVQHIKVKMKGNKNIGDRTTLKIRENRNPEHKGICIVDVHIDEERILSIWCNRITIIATKPPLYSFYYETPSGSKYICSLQAKMTEFSKGCTDYTLPETLLTTLKKYIKIVDE